MSWLVRRPRLAGGSARRLRRITTCVPRAGRSKRPWHRVTADSATRWWLRLCQTMTDRIPHLSQPGVAPPQPRVGAGEPDRVTQQAGSFLMGLGDRARPDQVPHPRPRQQTHPGLRRGAHGRGHPHHPQPGPSTPGAIVEPSIGTLRRESLDQLMIIEPATSGRCCRSSSGTTTPTAHTGRLISTRPPATALGRPSDRPAPTTRPVSAENAVTAPGSTSAADGVDGTRRVVRTIAPCSSSTRVPHGRPRPTTRTVRTDRSISTPADPTPPPSGAAIRPLRRDRLGGLIHEYVQVA
jgi:hypothetical protein